MNKISYMNRLIIIFATYLILPPFFQSDPIQKHCHYKHIFFIRTSHRNQSMKANIYNWFGPKPQKVLNILFSLYFQ